MKYMLDIALVIGLLWIGYMWNGEQKKGGVLEENIAKLDFNVAQLKLDLDKATNALASATTDLAATKAQVEQASKDLLEKTDALGAKTAEADELRTALAAAVARVKELEGYKAKAIVAEMPKPIQPAP